MNDNNNNNNNKPIIHTIKTYKLFSFVMCGAKSPNITATKIYPLKIRLYD